jgi:GT2 family glycosyltransferase
LPLNVSGVSARVYAKQIWQALGEQINAHLREDGLPEVTTLDAAGLPVWQTPQCVERHETFLQTAPFASVVLSTRDRPDHLARCLPTLLAQRYPDYEIIVVDNAPSTSAAADLIQRLYAHDPRVRYVREDYPGISSARNRGILEARGEIIAFADDDVVFDVHWLAGLAKGFKVTENATCVTSLILPLELETPTQIWFEEFGGFNRGFVRRVFDRVRGKNDMSLYPFAAGVFGAGAAMAFTTQFLQEEKGFDPALGTGSCAGGGEDLAAFLRVIMRGNRLVYEPTSLAYHQHRRDYRSFQKQMYFYGTGLTAYLTKIIVDNPLLLCRLITLIPHGLVHILSSQSAKNQTKSSRFPKELTRLERRGMLQGPFLYLQGRCRKQ